MTLLTEIYMQASTKRQEYMFSKASSLPRFLTRPTLTIWALSDIFINISRKTEPSRSLRKWVSKKGTASEFKTMNLNTGTSIRILNKSKNYLASIFGAFVMQTIKGNYISRSLIK